MTIEESLQSMVEIMSAPDCWKITSVIAGIVSTIIAGIAICMNAKTISMQNKQSLFEKRVATYMRCRTCYEAYNRCRDHLTKMQISTAPLTGLIDLYVLCDFNNLGLQITKFPKQDDYEMRSVYLMAMQNTKDLTEKCSLLFKKNVAKDVCCFLEKYEKLITCLYEYQWTRAKLPKKFKDVKEWQGLNQALNDMGSFTQKIDISQSLKKIKKEIRL